MPEGLAKRVESSCLWEGGWVARREAGLPLFTIGFLVPFAL